jgi:MiaB/RimO family radical SAM methylthiotransferase
LLKALLENQGEYRIRLGMMNPDHLKSFREELAETFQDERLYKFLHLPLQSGSDRVLKKMKRKYSVKEFREEVRWLRKRIEGLTLATDVIAGFPGESEKDFLETMAVLKEVEPDVVNISRFGKRPGTLAEKMVDLPLETKKERSQALTRLCAGLAAEKNAALKGKKLKVLVAEKGRKGNFQGRSDSYKPVIVKENLLGEFAWVKVTQAFPTYVEARLEKP